MRVFLLMLMVAVAADAVDVIRIEVWKSARKLAVYRGKALLKTYRVALGRNPQGHKQREGDGRTPEGRYTIDFLKPKSTYYRGLRISYPNAADRESARRRGVPLGGLIYIHGLGRFASVGARHVESDWTEGCIALTNEEMDELWSLVQLGTVVDIHP